MAEQTAAPVAEPQPTPAPQVALDPQGDNRAVAEAAAQQLMDALKGDGEAVERARDESGRFVGKAEPKPEAAQPAAPALDPLWVEAAKAEGLTDLDLQGVTNEQDIRDKIVARRVTGEQDAMQRLGLTPEALQTVRAILEQQAGAPQQGGVIGQPQVGPTAAQQAAAAIADLSVKIDETELDPHVAGPLKEVVGHLNRVTAALNAALTDNQQLRQAVTQTQEQVRQSAEQARMAAGEALVAEQYDRAAAEIEGFVDLLGKPSEVKRLAHTSPRNPKVLAMKAFGQYFEAAYQESSRLFGESPMAVRMAMRQAWRDSPFGSQRGAGGPNGRNQQPNGVVRSTQRRAATVEPVGDERWEAERQRALEAVGAAWDESGGNPFAALS